MAAPPAGIWHRAPPWAQAGAGGKAATTYGWQIHRSRGLALDFGAVVYPEAESECREKCSLLLRGIYYGIF